MGDSGRADTLNWLRSFDAQTLDAHCHLQRVDDFAAAVAWLAAQGRTAFCVTETPAEYEACCAALPVAGDAETARIALGLGLHPWRVSAATDAAELETQLLQFSQLLPSARLVGEVGLDFSPAHDATHDAQIAAFSQIASLCAQAGGKVLSIHAVRSAGTALQVLRASGCLETCVCIFHWFLGTGDELIAAREAGCFFSAGPQMLATRRGQAYVRQIPADRLLFETDFYPDGAFDAAGYQMLLR